MDHKKIGILLTARANSTLYMEGLRDADIRTLGEAIKVCAKPRMGSAVNYKRLTVLVDHLVTVVTQAPKMEIFETVNEGRTV